ncbi:uncharacterized protein BDR25DRAFT_287027 [Lindgomyces ingoldianus]|uniref:Uncharacterized protein n=1 Tax=Lindgomyces ingoldianus TaxID=673940 RepID=A0ACB6QV03_9PLEO|nr:uncharacterized protein BDR25DRAFT_287027 [Lindgomyces ingoldianus]KAF2470808.1 hypothetical protein BDR25DRAFT_287027 [Lindgomyces ingoldianus]
MDSTRSLVTLLSNLYGNLSSVPKSITSEEQSSEKLLNWPSISNFLSVVTSSGLRQYDQGLFLSGLHSASLGEGRDYRVDLCEESGTGNRLIVKHVKLEPPPPGTVEQAKDPVVRRFRKVLKEVRVMSHPPLKNCKYILGLSGYGWEYADQAYLSPFLVVEYANRGTLRDFFRSMPSTSWEQKRAICEQIARGLFALHSSAIVHGDVKMENILICEVAPEVFCAKIADFGSSILAVGENGVRDYWGTELYNAPELRKGQLYHKDRDIVAENLLWACDIYSYGLLVWEVVRNGRNFFAEERAQSAVDGNEYGQIIDIALKDCDMEREAGDSSRILFKLRRVVEHALHLHPSERWKPDVIISALENVKQQESLVCYPLHLPSKDTTLRQSPRDIFSDLVTEFSTDEVSESTIRIPPWDIQMALASGIRQHTEQPDSDETGKAALNMSILYFLGFGVERDIERALSFMKLASQKGSVAARHLVARLHAAFNIDLVEESVDALDSPSEEDQASIIISALKETTYYTPWHEVDLVSQRKMLQACDHSGFGIHELAYLGITDRLNKLLVSGTKDCPDDVGRTALYFACWGGHLPAIQSLLAHGSEAWRGDRDGYTPLHFMIMLPQEDVVDAVDSIMRSPNVDINAYASEPLELLEGWIEVVGAPIHWAIASRNETLVIALLQHGADITSWDTERSPIHLAASLHLYDILEILLKPAFLPSIEALHHIQSPFFSLNRSDPIWRTALHGKIWKEAIQQTISILARHWDVNEISHPEFGLTPLSKIAYTNISDVDVEIAACLIAHPGCTPDVQSSGITALQAAIFGIRGVPVASHAKIAKLILDAGCSARKTSLMIKPGWNALHWAIAQNTISGVEAILMRDRDLLHVVTQDDLAEYPLHLATLVGCPMLKLLLDFGANPALETKSGLTPLGSYLSDQRAETPNEMLDALLSAARTNNYIVFKRDEEDWTVLHYTVTRASILSMEGIQGQLLLQTLLSNHPDLMRELLDVRTKAGWTPLHLAAYNSGYGAVRLLCEFGADVLLETRSGVDAFNIVLERARHTPPKSLRGEGMEIKWMRSGYKAAKLLKKYMAERDCIIDLTKLHLAAYMGYYEKVVRLVEKGMNPSITVSGETPAQMLEGSLWNGEPEFKERARRILDFLKKKGG